MYAESLQMQYSWHVSGLIRELRCRTSITYSLFVSFTPRLKDLKKMTAENFPCSLF